MSALRHVSLSLAIAAAVAACAPAAPKNEASSKAAVAAAPAAAANPFFAASTLPYQAMVVGDLVLRAAPRPIVMKSMDSW